jgi:hypothetical protein
VLSQSIFKVKECHKIIHVTDPKFWTKRNFLVSILWYKLFHFLFQKNIYKEWNRIYKLIW